MILLKLKYLGRISFLVLGCAIACNFISISAESANWGKVRRTRDLVEDLALPQFAKVPAGKNLEEAGRKLKEADERYSKCNGIDIRELTVLQVQELFAKRKLTSVALTRCYLQRINQMNPDLNAVIQLNRDALRQAAQADLERAMYYAGGGEPNLDRLMLGIPMLIKDNVGTNDLMETTVGSLAMVGIRPKRDADVVTALRKAGVVILGKANLSEWAHWRGENMTNGWSGRGGQTRNAYNLSGDASESSSGSAASVAANLAMVSIGTETDGSLMAPASVEGLFTMKPTFGTPSIRGVVPLSHTQDHVGPMTRTATDMAILLDAMVPSADRKNVETCGGSYTKCLLEQKEDEVFSLGVLRYPFWDPNIINSTQLTNDLPELETFLSAMKVSSSLEITDPVEYPRELVAKVKRSDEFLVVAHDFKYDFNEYLKNDVIHMSPRKISSLADVIQFNKGNAIESTYDQFYLLWSESTDGIQNATYLKAREAAHTPSKQMLDAVLVKAGMDAVIAPSEPRNQGMLDPTLEDVPPFLYSYAAITGYPCVNVPAGIGPDGMPFGLTLVGLPHSEAKLLRIAHKLEQFGPKRQPPTFLA